MRVPVVAGWRGETPWVPRGNVTVRPGAPSASPAGITAPWEAVELLERRNRGLGRDELRIVLLAGDDFNEREVEEEKHDEEREHRRDGRCNAPVVPPKLPRLRQAASPGAVDHGRHLRSVRGRLKVPS